MICVRVTQKFFEKVHDRAHHDRESKQGLLLKFLKKYVGWNDDRDGLAGPAE